MLYYLIPFVPGMIAMIVFLKLRVSEKRAAAVIAKAITSVFFILCAGAVVLSRAGENQDVIRYGILITLGLVCGLLGDVWLDFKFILREFDKQFTYAGFISFAIGHLFFLTAMIRYFKPTGYLIAIAAAISVIAGCAVAFGGKIMKLEYGSFKAITGCYGALLFFVTTIALMSVITGYGGTRVPQAIMLAGAVLFLVSDLILSNTYFGVGYDKPVHIISNHVTYYLAQFLIAASVLAFAAV